MKFKEQDSVFAEKVEYGLPRIYNLYTDPQVKMNVFFPQTWVSKAAFGTLAPHMGSLQLHSPIKPGAQRSQCLRTQLSGG